MLTIASAEPLMAEKLPIPILSVQGRVPPANSLLTLDNLTDNAATWPEFHNGTAAALRVGPKVMASALRANDANPSSSSHDNNRSRQHGMRAVTRNWIMYNKTAAQATTHGENTHAGIQIAAAMLAIELLFNHCLLDATQDFSSAWVCLVTCM